MKLPGMNMQFQKMHILFEDMVVMHEECICCVEILNV